MSNKANSLSELTLGIILLVVLALLTVVEYLVAAAGAPNVFLWMIAIAKAALVLWFFMHIRRIFKQDGGHS